MWLPVILLKYVGVNYSVVTSLTFSISAAEVTISLPSSLMSLTPKVSLDKVGICLTASLIIFPDWVAIRISSTSFLSISLAETIFPALALTL